MSLSNNEALTLEWVYKHRISGSFDIGIGQYLFDTSLWDEHRFSMIFLSFCRGHSDLDWNARKINGMYPRINGKNNPRNGVEIRLCQPQKWRCFLFSHGEKDDRQWNGVPHSQTVTTRWTFAALLDKETPCPIHLLDFLKSAQLC